MASKLARVFLIFSLVIPIALAQSASPNSSAAELKKARDERDKKTFALVDELISEAQSLKLAENHIRVDVALAGSLWAKDEKRAGSLFKEAVASLNAITLAVDGGDPDYLNLSQLPQQLRQEILQVAASRDARLALDFLRSTRPTSTSHQPFSEAQLEMRLALQIAEKDPREALAAAEDSLRFGVDYETMNFLYRIESKDKAAGEIFLADLLNRIRASDFNKSQVSSYIALTLVRTWIENKRSTAIPRTTTIISLPNFDEQTARELSSMVLNAALSNGPSDSSAYQLYSGMTGTLQQLKAMQPEIERLAPNRAGELRSRIDEFDKFSAAQQGPWAQYNDLIQNGSVETMIEASKTAPPGIADRLVQQAASKASSQGDFDTAYQMLEIITDPRQRADMKANVDRQAFYRAREQKKLGEAHTLISRLASIEDQVSFLTQLAASSELEGDKPAALQLLAEAEALLGDRAQGYGQLEAKMQIAKGYQQLDTGKSIAIVERVIDQINELSAAALVLNGFDVQGYFRNGEFIITNGGNPLNMMAQQCGRELGSSARDDLDGARAAAERFQRREMRVIALLQIAQALLASDASL